MSDIFSRPMEISYVCAIHPSPIGLSTHLDDISSIAFKEAKGPEIIANLLYKNQTSLPLQNKPLAKHGTIVLCDILQNRVRETKPNKLYASPFLSSIIICRTHVLMPH